jgi:hypothetical protein
MGIEVLSWLFVIWMVVGFILDTRWAQRKRALRKPFGEQRVQILETRWHLEGMCRKSGDPSGAISRAIHECDVSMNQIDQAVVVVRDQHAIEDVAEQRRIADLILKTCREDIRKFADSPRRMQNTEAVAFTAPLRQLVK